MTDDSEMFMTLFHYIDGANSENENIDMTTPVSTKWQEDGFHEECFYLSQEHQANPPKPNSPNVYIVVRPAMTVFTRFVISIRTLFLIIDKFHQKISFVIDLFVKRSF